MGEYEIGKDVKELQDEVRRLAALIEQTFGIIEHNMDKGKLIMPQPATRK